MLIPSKDSTQISFGKLSDPGVLNASPLSREHPNLRYFTSENFQYIVDNIADMFGFAHGAVQASVVEKDHVVGWHDENRNGRMEDDELSMQFVMNAQMHTYSRESFYGKYFMFMHAQEYGAPFIFGVIAHEIGHLVNRYAMNALESRIVNGVPCLVETCSMNALWDELCADYLSGVVLAKALPRLSHEPVKKFLQGAQADAEHPDGFWRVYAVEMGYRWGSANSPMLTDRILTDRVQINQLLESFFHGYYRQVYCAVDPAIRQSYSRLPQHLLEHSNTVLGTL